VSVFFDEKLGGSQNGGAETANRPSQVFVTTHSNQNNDTSRTVPSVQNCSIPARVADVELVSLRLAPTDHAVLALYLKAVAARASSRRTRPPASGTRIIQRMSVKDLFAEACARLAGLTTLTPDGMRLAGYPDSSPNIDVCQ
jgi:hypothetical protein